MKYINTLFLCFALLKICIGQITQPEHIVNNSLEVIGKSYLDSVIIRFAPTSSDLWLIGNKYGYRIIRKTVGYGDSIFNDKPIITLLNSQPIKPLPLEQIKPIAEKDIYAGIVAQAIYGNTFDITTSDPENLINKAREIDNRFSFSLFSCDMSRVAAKVHGLIYLDKDIRKDGHYIYQVFFDNAVAIKYDTGLLYIRVADTFSLPKPIDLQALTGNKSITLRWNKKMFNDIYTAYIVERSEDGKKFIKRNDNPMVNLFNNPDKEPAYNIFVDSIPENQKNFIYRVRGISPLGEIGPPSDTVVVRGIIAMYMLNPMITSSEILTDGAVKIHWEIPYADSIYAREFIVHRAETSEGKYEKLSTSKITGAGRSFIDNKPMGVNYYVVEVEDELSRRYRSFPSLVMLEDSIAPCVPKDLTGICDSLGIIHLEWEPCTEKDLAGYKIFRYNNPGLEPMKINDSIITGTMYNDTLSLNTLTNYFYYSVASFDNHYNQSDYSGILKVRLFDTIAPPAVSFIKYDSKNGVINLFWNKSISSDAVNYLIYRKLSEDNNWELIAKCKTDETQYSDSSFKNNYNEYLITCMDEVGNESVRSQVLGVKVMSVTNLETPQIFIKNKGNKTSVITYKSRRSDVKRVMIYRSINDEPLTLFSSQEFNKDGFTDTQLIIGNIYNYKIQYVYIDGSRSGISDTIINKM